jgi:hypothetical protein
VIEHTEVQGIPVTFYEAEVIYNIKGDLEGNIKLMQFVGYRELEKIKNFLLSERKHSCWNPENIFIGHQT